ncbi:type II toxin-antitoxin system RelE/ParE family toxin [Cyanobium sp. HWJ4-Hawea]|uniref:type II toxin-antitoxin system RelE/ParE family toxin n=1 Tax=Cyanobium sp. HWJ4-Hawea TaxID=2823713 RepID=UPI0020CB8523|nr:type II toxin-antitoxin system RelE/ParE family toxin [Cyanobium sp. HWJ4-Hawea]MCP9808459.1 type II toxin-antitoxin system RelE/ParE family toxin [Cyanobium sp. HWJ4-Hawea]
MSELPASQLPWKVVFAAEAVNDLLLITEYLNHSYCGFGEPPAEANRHAQVRIEAIITAAERLATAPFRGETHDDLLPGLRHLALDRAVYWSQPHAEQREIQVLAVFFGGQDHQRRMLVRLLQNSPNG